MIASVDIVQRVDYEVELAEKAVPEVILLNATFEGDQVHLRILLKNSLAQASGFWLANMLSAEQELAIEVAHIDCVEIDHLDVVEAGHAEALDKFTPDAACPNHEHFCIIDEFCNLGSID